MLKLSNTPAARTRLGEVAEGTVSADRFSITIFVLQHCFKRGHSCLHFSQSALRPFELVPA